MTLRTPSSVRWSTLAVLALVLVVAGCSSDKNAGPLSPGSQSVGPQQGLGVAQDAGGWHTVDAVIDGAVGGTISKGRYTLTIPPGAFAGSKTITMQCASGNNLEVICLPEGLQFQVPASLEMNVAGTGLDVSDATIYWYNPTQNVWVDMNGMYQSGKHTVTALIPHFSCYQCGRGGW